MFKQRLISSLIFVPISLAAFYFGNWALLLFMGLVLGLGAYEYSRILNQAGLRVNQVMVVGGVLALVALRHFFAFQYGALSVSALLLGLAGHALFQYERGNDQAYQQFALELSGVLYLGWLGAYSIFLASVA